MKNSETGEYELVVGNRQVVSAFFIVALLCGVAFVMGYVVGANAPRSPKTQTEAVAAPAQMAPQEPRPQSSQPLDASQQAAPPASDSSQQQTADAEQKPADPPPQPTTQPARETPAPPPVVAQTPGSYWQTGAFHKASEAQTQFENLKYGGMPVIQRNDPDGLVHVLVGPYPDAASLSKARTELETRFGLKKLTRK